MYDSWANIAWRLNFGSTHRILAVLYFAVAVACTISYVMSNNLTVFVWPVLTLALETAASCFSCRMAIAEYKKNFLSTPQIF